MTNTLTITDLATEFDVTTRTIRFYEEKGLLTPARNGNSRIYSPADRVKLKLILRGKRLGLTLEESRDIINMYDPAHGNVEQLQKIILKFRDKRAQLEQQFHDLKVMIMELCDAEEKCLQALEKVQPETVARKKVSPR
jgi:DNA-binding transcriptional MerR regulator